MDLFNQITPHENLLPYDGAVYYYGKIMSGQQANEMFESLLTEIAWQHDEVLMYGKLITTKRKVAWYGDAGLEYTYSGRTKKAKPWTGNLLTLKTMVEEKTGETFNTCLLNLYHSGEEGIAWHSDDEKSLKEGGVISSLSFGAVRKFLLRHKSTKETISLMLEHGSLLEMRGTTQKNWLHRLPPMAKVKNPRVNLTFRTIAI